MGHRQWSKTTHFSLPVAFRSSNADSTIAIVEMSLVKDTLCIMAARLHLKVLSDSLLGVQISCTIYITQLRFFPCPKFPGNLEHLNVELVGVWAAIVDFNAAAALQSPNRQVV